MNKLAIIILGLAIVSCTSSKVVEQEIIVSNPDGIVRTPHVAWQFQGEQNNVKWYSLTTVLGKLTNVKLKAEIGEGWHLYSQHLESDMGPVATSFISEDIPKLIFSEKSEVHKTYDESFAMNVAYFESEALYEAIISTTSNEYNFIVSYMVCNEETCLPPVDQTFKITTP